MIQIDLHLGFAYRYYLCIYPVAVSIYKRHYRSLEETFRVEIAVGGEDIHRQIDDVIIAPFAVCIVAVDRKLEAVADIPAVESLFELRQHHTRSVNIFEWSLRGGLLH